MKRLLLALALALPLIPQSAPLYFAEHEFSSTTDKVTIQQPATPLRALVPKFALLYNSGAAALDFTISRAGTAATTTALTPVTWVEGANPRSGLAFSASNAGAGVTGPKYSVPAGGTYNLDLSESTVGKSPGENFSIAAASGSGRISIFWTELPQ